MSSYTFETYYAKKRDMALLQQRLRQQNALHIIPELQNVIADCTKAYHQWSMAKLQHKDADEVKRCEDDLQILLQKRKELLREHNLDENYLDVIYECNICHDSGRDENDNICICCQKQKEAKQEILSSLDEEKCFECSDLSIFPDEGDQRAMISKIQDQCYQYANSYPDMPKLNLFLVGPCGSGKSFLLSCIGNYIQQTKDVDVIYITGVYFKDIIINDVLGKRSEAKLKQIYNVPFLIFDDLGSEPSINEIIPQYFYELIEYRREKKLPWAMATNLKLRVLQERYGERSFSRLFDKKTSLVWQMPMNGKDVRLFGRNPS